MAVDGCKGDIYYNALQRGFLPNIQRLTQHHTTQHSHCSNVYDTECAHTHSGNTYKSKYRTYGQTTHNILSEYVWLTSPGWASVLTGVDNKKHGIVDNDLEYKQLFTVKSKQYPTLLIQAKQHNYTTAAAGTPDILSAPIWPIYTPQWLLQYIQSDNNKQGIIDFECSTDPDIYAQSTCNLNYRKSHLYWDTGRDLSTTQFAVEHITGQYDECADVIVAHYDKVDHAGHHHGFSDNHYYINELQSMDAQFGQILDSIESASNERNEQWLIVITADHGGYQHGHGYTLFHDQAVPFTMSVVQPINIHTHQYITLSELQQPIRHYDVAPTVMHWLGVETQSDYDGQIQGLTTI